MFEKPPILVKHPSTWKLVDYNTDLVFDESFIYCGNFNFTYEDFYQIRMENGMEDCVLANGQRTPIEHLWSELIGDFSFKMTRKMDEV